MKKIISIILSVTLIFSLIGCGTKSKPEDTVVKLCEALKNFDAETFSECLLSESEEINDVLLGETGEDDELVNNQEIIDYLKNNATQMSYTIGEIAVDGTEALVPVTFTYVNAGPAVSATLGEYIAQAFVLAFSGTDDSSMQDLFTALFLEKVETLATITETSLVEFECVKINDEWKVKDLSEETSYELSNVLMSNIVKTIEDFGEGFETSDTDTTETIEEYVWQDVPTGTALELETIKIAVVGSEEVDQLKAEYFETEVAQEGTKYVVVAVEIENITKSTLDFSNDIILTDNQGREYEAYDGAIWYFDETFTYTDLAPNIKETGHFVYNVPSDSEGYYLSLAKAGTNEAYRMYVK